jgi:tRNA-dihydrouridine synthase B
MIPHNQIFAAPMAGISDYPFRRMIREFAPGVPVVTEMISCHSLVEQHKNCPRNFDNYGTEGNVGTQIFGAVPDLMADAARILEDAGATWIDINMGCPVPKVVKNGDGSALLKDPVLIEAIVAAAVANTSRPVTVKIRKGFGRGENCAVEAALAAQAGGAAAVAVHGRTREQYYTGEADWNVIRKVKEALTIPVIGNGDVTDVTSAFRMMEETGCDMVMIGRGMMGNPWLFRDLNRAWRGLESLPAPCLAEKKAMLLRQLDALVAYKGAYIAVREMRKICSWYVKGMPGSASFRQKVNRLTDVEALRLEIQGLPE